MSRLTNEDDTFFERHSDALYARFAGKYILIHQGHVVGVYGRQDAAIAAAEPLGSCLIRHLGPDTTFTGPGSP